MWLEPPHFRQCCGQTRRPWCARPAFYSSSHIPELKSLKAHLPALWLTSLMSLLLLIALPVCVELGLHWLLFSGFYIASATPSTAEALAPMLSAPWGVRPCHSASPSVPCSEKHTHQSYHGSSGFEHPGCFSREAGPSHSDTHRAHSIFFFFSVPET